MNKISEENSGFGAVGVILVIAIVGALGLAGWYVYDHNKNDDPEDSQTFQQNSETKDAMDSEDETAGWKTVESIGGAYTIKVPQGWKLASYPGNTIAGDEIVYSGDQEAVITNENSAYAGDQRKFNVTFSTQAHEVPQWQSPNQYGVESVTDFAIGDLQGKRYSIEWTETVTGVTEGDIIYQYVFNLDSGKQLNVVYMYQPADGDTLELVEKVIKTITLN